MIKIWLFYSEFTYNFLVTHWKKDLDNFCDFNVSILLDLLFIHLYKVCLIAIFELQCSNLDFAFYGVHCEIFLRREIDLDAKFNSCDVILINSMAELTLLTL